MKAMVLHKVRSPLTMEERPLPSPAANETRVAVEACAACPTNLHVVDGDLPHPRLPLIPGHEIVGQVEALGSGGRNREERAAVGTSPGGRGPRPLTQDGTGNHRARKRAAESKGGNHA